MHTNVCGNRCLVTNEGELQSIIALIEPLKNCNLPAAEIHKKKSVNLVHSLRFPLVQSHTTRLLGNFKDNLWRASHNRELTGKVRER